MASFDKEITTCRLVNSRLFTFLNSFSSGYESTKLAEILKDKKIREKLATGIEYFAEYKKESPSKKKIDKGELKWTGDKEIGGTLKEYIYSLADDWNLDEKNVFEILDGYFRLHPSEYSKIEQ